MNRDLGWFDVLLVFANAIILAVLAGCVLSAVLLLVLTRLFG